MEYYNQNQLSYGRGYVYSIQYHIVWCVKYRKKLLNGEIETFLKKEITQILTEMDVSIVAMECDEDHIHLLINCSPQHYIPTMIKILKGNTARHLFMTFPAIKNQLYDGHLWNPSYFVATVSDNTKAQVEEYIRNQKVRK